MKTIIEIEIKKGKQINYKNIQRVMCGRHERHGQDITVKFEEDGTYTAEKN